MQFARLAASRFAATTTRAVVPPASPQQLHYAMQGMAVATARRPLSSNAPPAAVSTVYFNSHATGSAGANYVPICVDSHVPGMQ